MFLVLFLSSISIAFVPSTIFGYQYTFKDLGIAHRVSNITGKMLVINFSSPSCYYCILFDKETLTNKQVQEFLRGNYIYVKIEPGSYKTTFLGKSYTNDQLFGAFGIRGTPTFIFMKGNEVVTQVPGYMKPDMFLKALRYLVRSVENGLKESFESYSKREDNFAGNPKILSVSKSDADFVLKSDKNAEYVESMPKEVDINKLYVTNSQTVANQLNKAGVIRVLLVTTN
ncbi:thioredoxin [Fervidobacterium thailandense]|uniref:Thioredoxin n=1 Tax=Fervidobacterium thailandense TaxID=1008305 RepID=A0A1E3G383_9BACT|nr:thioredoxin [Fervidobacterium thailandense]